MAHDVFISHAHKDRKIADAICEKLESAQLKCWIAERDIPAGDDWTEATRNAIGSSRVILLVLSENANAAPHIEREIAHAFYTKRSIVPFRLTNTLPRRDFLFYLGNVRWFDAFNLPAEQHLEALTASIHGMVRGPTVTRDAVPQDGAQRTTTRLRFLNSWIGPVWASHYQTLEILKRLAIAASVLAAVWLFWLVLWQSKDGASQPERNLHSTYSGPSPSSDSSPEVSGDASVSRPSYTFTRFGLWVPQNSAPPDSVQQRPKDMPSTTPKAQSASTTPLPRSDIEQKPGAEVHDSASAKSVQGDPTRRIKRRARHRGKSRLKRHNEKGRVSEGS